MKQTYSSRGLAIVIAIAIMNIFLCENIQAKEAMPYSKQSITRLGNATDKVEMPGCSGNVGERAICYYRYMKKVYSVAGFDLDKSIIKVSKDIENNRSGVLVYGGQYTNTVIQALESAGVNYDIKPFLPKSTYAVIEKKINAANAARAIEEEEKKALIDKANKQFIKHEDGTVLDTRTNLMWAAKDNGSRINWADAKSYCENYRGGDYTDWRMPTKDELKFLYDKSLINNSTYCYLTTLITLTDCFQWASEKGAFDAAGFNFNRGDFDYSDRDGSGNLSRVLPVRSGK